eukprot:7816125-Pyramimonas_sp.AAC.1
MVVASDESGRSRPQKPESMPNLAWKIFTKSEGAEMQAPMALRQIMSHGIWAATTIDTPRLTLHTS